MHPAGCANRQSVRKTGRIQPLEHKYTLSGIRLMDLAISNHEQTENSADQQQQAGTQHAKHAMPVTQVTRAARVRALGVSGARRRGVGWGGSSSCCGSIGWSWSWRIGIGWSGGIRRSWRVGSGVGWGWSSGVGWGWRWSGGICSSW